MMADNWRSEWKRAERRLLAISRVRTITPTAQLLSRADEMRPPIDTSLIRGAYWTLVKEGALVRTPRGVHRRACTSDD